MARVAGRRPGMAQERRAALIQYHTDAEERNVIRAMHVEETVDFDGLKMTVFEASRVRTGSDSFTGGISNAVKASWLFPKAFAGLSGATDKNLLQQFKRGLSADAVKTATLQNGTDSFTEVIEVAAEKERVMRELTMLKVSVSGMKTDVDPDDKHPVGKFTEATAAAVTTRKEAGEILAEEHPCGCKEIAAIVCCDGPFWDDARLRHGDVTGVLELECRPSTVGGSVGVRVTRIFDVVGRAVDCWRQGLSAAGHKTVNPPSMCRVPNCSQLGRQCTLPQTDAVSERRVVAYASRMLTKQNVSIARLREKCSD
ncbi:hypothetical protein T07_4332 [Trichinella nelsoni]|uniref:Uncharacterized protein n=1 Tax=Trichinella nelsoni TaxID=6336 RepID=A0A0V0RJP6_9BILA|nr:hypothetical protein T07_4332 [Trichinella nelsoni]